MADPISIDDLKAPPASAPAAPAPLTIDDMTVSPVSPSVGLMRDLGPYGASTGAITPDTGAVDAMARGLRQFQLGLANTLDKLGVNGAAEWRDGLQTMMAFNQQRYNPEGASFLERGLEGTTAMLPTIAAGAVAAIATGGAAVPEEIGLLGTAAVNAWRASRVLKASMLAGSVAMEAQQYGDFYDEIDRASGGRLTPEQLHGLTFSRSLIDATLENVIPAEAILSVGAANISKAVAGRWLKTEGGKESLELMGRSIFGFPMAGGFGRFALAFPGELLEEGAQQANGSLFDAYASGQPVDLMAVAADSYDAMIQAIPAITMMVGMGAFVGAAKKEAVKRTTMAGVGEAETADHPHWRAVDEVLYGVQQPDGSVAVDPALKQKEADTVTALTELWSKNGAQAARESAQLVVQLAKNLAVQDRAAGNVSAQAWDYTDGLSVGFGDMALADISTIRDMRAGGATGSQLLDFMLKASPAFANSIDSVFQKRETIRLNRENEVLRGTLKTVLRGTNPKAVLEGVDPKAISGRLKTAVDTYGLPDPTDPSEARIRIIPAPVVKAALGNRSLAAALAAQPMIVSPFGWEGVLEVRADGSATLTPVRPKKGKGSKAPIAGAPPVEAGQEAAQITAEAQKVEQDIRHQLVMRSVPTTVVGEAGPTLPTQTPQARLAEVERGTLEAADKAATDPNVEHATALRENLRLRHQNLMMENFGANWDAIPAAVAPEKPPEWKAADLSSRALPEYVDVEAQATEMLRQMEVSGVTEVEDQLTALKNAAKATGVQVAANENALSIATKIVEAKAKAEAAAAVKPEQPEQLTLLQDGKELSGLYLPDRALMVYFRSADAGTFIHEWLHHVTTQRLLPSAIERTLLNAYGTDEDRQRGYIGSQQAHEDIANSLLLYIRDGQLPDNVDGEILKAFEHLKAVMKGSYSVLQAYDTKADLQTPGSISDLFGNLLKDVVPSESQQIAGETAAAGMQRNPPSQAEADLETEVGEALGGFAQERDIPQNAVAAEVGVRFNGSLRVEELHDDYYTDDAETGGTFAVPAGSDATAVRAALESMRQRFAANPPLAQEKHKRPEGVSKESMAKTRAFRAALNNRAVATAAKLGYNIKSLYDLGLDDSGKFNNDLYQQRISNINSVLRGQARSVKGVRRQLLKESALAKEGEAISAAIKDELRAQPDSIEELSYGAKGGPKFFYWAMKAVKGGYRAISRFWNTMETTALFFSAGNYKSAFYDLYWRRTNADTNAISELNIKRANEDIAAGMLNINRFDKVNLGGQEYLLTHALAFYAAADGKKIGYSLSQLSEKVEAAVANGDLSELSEAEKKIYTLTQSNVMGNYRVTLAAINDAVSLVSNSPKYMALMSYTQKQMGVAHGWMDTAMKSIYDRGLPKRPGLYMTFQREDGHDDYMDTFEDPLKLEAFARGAPLPSYVKARSQMRGSAVSIDYLGAYDRYMATMANASTRLPTVLQQLQVLRDKGEGSVWHLIGRKYGTDTDQMGMARMKMLQNLEEQAQATMRISGRTRPPTDTDLWIRNKIRIPSSVATLGVKPWIAVSQFLSTVSAMSEIPVLGALADMRSAIAWTLRSTASQMREDAGKIARGEQVVPQDLPLAGHPDFERMAAKSPLLRSMLGEWELLEAQAKKPNVLDRLARQYGVGHSFIDAAFKAMRVADQINKYTIFKGSYTAKKAELLDQGLSEAAAEAQAIEYGEGVVRDHVPIANNTLRTLFHNSPEIVRLLAPFSSQPIAYFNTLQRKYIVPFVNAYRMAEGGNFEKWKAAFGTQVTREQLRRTLFMFVLPAILWNALQRRRPPEKEELIADLLLYPFSYVPLAGDFVQQARMGFSDVRQGDVRIPGNITFYDTLRTVRGINGLYKAAMGDDVDWSREWKDLMAMPSDVLGLPKFLTNMPGEILRIRGETDDKAERIQQALWYVSFGGPPKPRADD